ncbi:MAG: Gfo/Idh/MocA family protein [Caldilineaceae bacterium]
MSTSNKVWRVAYIGAGAIVKYAHIPNFSLLPNTQNVAICDVNEARATALATDAGIPAVYSDYHTMLDEVRPDITVVATPNVFHKPMAMAALEAGSHVLCEKPLAPSYDDAVALFEAARLAGKVLTVGTHFRYGANMQALRGQARAGFFGKIYAIRTTWQRRSGIPGMGGWFTNRDLAAGGVLLDLGVHALDRALYVMDYPRPTTVTGMTFAEFGPRGMGAGGWGMDAMAPTAPAGAGVPRFDVDDMAWAAVRFETGAALLFQVAWASHHPEFFSVEVFGDQGGASLSERDKLMLYTNLNGQEVNVEVPLPTSAPASYAVLAQNFVRHLDGDPTSEIVTPEQALVSVQIVDAISRSAQTGREVAL